MDIDDIMEDIGRPEETFTATVLGRDVGNDERHSEPMDTYAEPAASPNLAANNAFQASLGNDRIEAAPRSESALEAEDSEDEDQPLSTRYARASLREGSSYDPGEASSSGNEEASAEEAPASRSQASKRRHVLPRIGRGQRCGHCHTCLNPKMKQACLTIRQQQMENMQRKGKLPGGLPSQNSAEAAALVAATKPTSPAKSAGRKAADFSGLEAAEVPRRTAPKRAVAQQDMFSREIQAIVNRNGGVEARFLPSLQRMYQKETQLERKLVLMTVLKQSPAGTLREAVRTQRIVLELQTWLQSAAEAKDFRLASRVIEMLDKLPIDLSALQSTGVGKTLAKLRKSGPAELKAGADMLVSKWKKAVDSDAALPSDGAKRPRDPEGEALAITKKAKPGAAAAKAAKLKATPELPRQVSVDSQDGGGPSAAAPMEVDDTAIFEQKRAVPSLTDSVFQMKKAHHIKLLNEDTVKKLKGQESAGEKGKKAANEIDEQEDEEHSPSLDPRGEPPKLGSRPPASAFASAALSLPLGSSRLAGAGSGITRIGGLGSSLPTLSLAAYEPPMDAAARAAAAAARIPEPVEEIKKMKAKSVSWLGDDQLVLVRWFRQADPVVAVKEDAKDTTEVDQGSPATAEEVHPPGFVSAAKREHQNEAAALRKNRFDVKESEETEEAEAPASVAPAAVAPPRIVVPPPRMAPILPPAPVPEPRWKPAINWPAVYRGPPLILSREAEFGMPTDEDRRTAAFLAMVEAVERTPAAVYASAALAPHTPLEPLPEPLASTQPLSIPCPRLDPPPAFGGLPNAPKIPNVQPPSGPPNRPQNPQPPQQPGLPGMNMRPPQMRPVPAAPLLQPPRPMAPGFGPMAMGSVRPAPGRQQPQMRPPFGGGVGPPPDARPPAPRPPDAEHRQTAPMRGRGRGRYPRGEDVGRGRLEGRGARGRGRMQEDFPGMHSGRRRPGEAPKPPHLVPCRWHFSGQGCKHGDTCRFSHTPIPPD